MFGWLRELYELRMEMKERTKDMKVCDSCETLKLQLAVVNQEKRELLDRILAVPATEEPVDTSNLKPITPKTHIAWRTRQQMLEREDRKTAQILAERSKTPEISTDELERELDIVAAEREGANAAK